MVTRTRAHAFQEDQQSFKWPFLISLAGHLILFGLIVVRLDFQSPPAYQPSVINVRMVELSDKPAASGSHTTSTAGKAPVEKKVQRAETKVPQQPKTGSQAKPEVSLAPHKARTKTALKYKTFKSKEVLKRAIEQLERKVETAPPRPLEDTIKRLKEEVEKTEKSEATEGGGAETTGPAKSGAFAAGSRQENEVIDIYRAEIAGQINKNWAFAEQLAGGKKLMASIIFKVMPDGKITDIFFTDHSGNPYLDDSAYKAIVKSSPVKPHPAGLQQPYVEMGLNFSPQGVQ